jgi:hypothetical protein
VAGDILVCVVLEHRYREQRYDCADKNNKDPRSGVIAIQQCSRNKWCRTTRYYRLP